MLLFTVQSYRILIIKDQVKEKYLAELQKLESKLKKPMNERDLVAQFLQIKNMALLRLQTCFNYCFDKKTEAELIEHIQEV